MTTDPRLWLEDIDSSSKALEWVNACNARTLKDYGDDDALVSCQGALLEAYQSKEKIPYPAIRGDVCYNFWTDSDNPRGIWRRTAFESFKAGQPLWEVMIDVDALNELENENWVWKGSTWLEPDFDRVLVRLSRGGADATVYREFDPVTGTFVENGFMLPEAKSAVSWIDKDTLFVATDFGEDSLTTSGYARTVKRWRRGTPLDQATSVFEGDKEDVSIHAFRDNYPGWEREFINQAIDFYSNRQFEITPDGLVQIQAPDDAYTYVYQRWLFIKLRTDWSVADRTFIRGSLLVIDYEAFMAGDRSLQILFAPLERQSLNDWMTTKNRLVINVSDNLQSKAFYFELTGDDWQSIPIDNLPKDCQIDLLPVSDLVSDDLWVMASGYLTPRSLTLLESNGEQRLIKKNKDWFDSDRCRVEQHEAVSTDGTRIPYTQITPSKVSPIDNPPTLLYGYGGFETSLLPYYNSTAGIGWLSKGGIYVVANIRGGGEFGPSWHQAAVKSNRYKALEDFLAVAQDLVKRKVTTAARLGIQGGSNGGLLVGNMLVQHPTSFGAAVCSVPLLDMKRYHRLLAGASWMSEYGDPDDANDWAYLQKFSPYHNLKKYQDYPPVLFTTSTRDDRVHPGHARKMAHALDELGSDVAFYENTEGGHGGAADLK